MAEALATLGVAANVLQFLDFAGGMVAAVAKTFQNRDGLVDANLDLERISEDLGFQLQKLRKDQSLINDKRVMGVLAKTLGLAKELEALLESIKFQPPSRRQVARIRNSVLPVRKKDSIDEFRKRLLSLRHSICFGISITLE